MKKLGVKVRRLQLSLSASHSFDEHFTCSSYRLWTLIRLEHANSFPSDSVNLKLQVAVNLSFFFPSMTIWENEDAIISLFIPQPPLRFLFVYPFILLPFLFPSTKAFFGLLSTHLRPNEISWVLIKDGVCALSERIQERRMSWRFFTSCSSCRLSLLHCFCLTLNILKCLSGGIDYRVVHPSLQDNKPSSTPTDGAFAFWVLFLTIHCHIFVHQDYHSYFQSQNLTWNGALC